MHVHKCTQLLTMDNNLLLRSSLCAMADEIKNIAVVMEELGDDSMDRIFLEVLYIRKCLYTNLKRIKLQVLRCTCKSTCKTARCPCKAASRSCTPLYKCGTRKRGCQNKLCLFVCLDFLISKKCDAKWVLDESPPRRFSSFHFLRRSALKAT